MSKDVEEGFENAMESSDPSSIAKIRGYVQGGLTANREWYINLLLVVLLMSGIAAIIFIFMEFWIIDLNLLKDPNPVWVHVIWFLPHAAVVLLLAQTMLYGVQSNPIQAPSIWLVVAAFVAFVFDIAALVFYQRLFWYCVLETGSFGTLEMQICNDSLLELSTLAWINAIFVAHALVSGITGVLVFTSDTEQFKGARSLLSSGFRKARSAAGSAAKRARSAAGTAKGKFQETFSGDSVQSAYTQKLNRRMGSRKGPVDEFHDW